MFYKFNNSKNKRNFLLTKIVTFMLLVHLIFAQTNCKFNNGVIIFGRSDGSIISKGFFRIRIPHERINCYNQGNWEKPGNSSRGVPYRSPCEMMSERLEKFPDIWLSDFAITSDNRVSYKWMLGDDWEFSNYLEPKKIIVNDYLNCHKNDPSMIIIENEKKDFIMEIGFPLEFAPGGEDISTLEALIIIIIMFIVVICIVTLAICTSGNNYILASDFVLGIIVGSLISSNYNKSSNEVFGKFGDD